MKSSYGDVCKEIVGYGWQSSNFSMLNTSTMVSGALSCTLFAAACYRGVNPIDIALVSGCFIAGGYFFYNVGSNLLYNGLCEISENYKEPTAGFLFFSGVEGLRTKERVEKVKAMQSENKDSYRPLVKDSLLAARLANRAAQSLI